MVHERWERPKWNGARQITVINPDRVAKEAANPRHLSSTLIAGFDPGQLEPAIRLQLDGLADKHASVFISPGIRIKDKTIILNQ
jgi:hypothetical protein